MKHTFIAPNFLLVCCETVKYENKIIYQLNPTHEELTQEESTYYYEMCCYIIKVRILSLILTKSYNLLIEM